MNSHVAPAYDVTMQQSTEQENLVALEQGPIVCPVCWDHGVERIEGVELTANHTDGKAISGAVIYHCQHWHIFAMFQQRIGGSKLAIKER